MFYIHHCYLKGPMLPLLLDWGANAFVMLTKY